MGSLKLEGETLGQKHQYYNLLLKEVTSTNTPQEINQIDYNEPDIDNLFKIDIAAKKHDVDYILEVLKCEDMLYVSRALKHSVWLITDTKHEDIINPNYLYTTLLPQMTSKAGFKLILTIRLNLKDEKRVEQFYKYYEEKKEFPIAIKWLQHCSISFIENVVKKHFSDISIPLLKRLCEKSITILEICAQKLRGHRLKELFSTTTFLLNNDVERFVKIIKSQQEIFYVPELSSKATQKIMKVKPDIIIENFEHFAKIINIPTFVKFLKREDVKDFVMKHLENDKLKEFFSYEIITHFIYRMPSESRLDFIKRICIEKGEFNSEESPENEYMYCYASESRPQTSNANIYKWYKCAPFSVAFTDLKKLIRVESNPSERNEILAVLTFCARRNSQNLQAVIQYYRDKHMNEPFKFKNHFVNIVLSQSDFHNFDDDTWSILNDIFHSMEVYTDSESNVQSCLKCIIIYKVVHDTVVPDVVEKKFKFNTLKSFRSKLNDEERDKVFNYLYQFIITKIQNVTINSILDLREIIKHIINALNLLSHWKKNILSYSVILENIKAIIKVNNKNSWNEDLSGVYNVNKHWRKHMFKESLFLHPSEETCVNALKHGPEILMLCRKNICSNDSIILTRLLSKLRIYWPHTLAKDFEDTFRNQLHEKTKHKTAVRGLCVLLPNKQLTDIIGKYTPQDTKINWAKSDDFTLSIQKCFAKYMLLARPHPPVDMVLLYAKGDYLQFVLPSVHSILFNISSDEIIKYVPNLLDAPVSLQKHGLNVAFAKLQMDKLLTICLNSWKSSKNTSIRATVFKLIFELLCKEQNETKITEIWHVLDSFIDELTTNENRVIYITLRQAKKVPLLVKQAYCIKSYRYFKSMPPKSNCDTFSEAIIENTLDVMEFIDIDFAAEIIFDLFDRQSCKQYYNSANIISTCLLSTKSEAIQTQRYEKIFVPVLKKILTFVKDTENTKFDLKYNFSLILQQLLVDFQDITINKNMITPVKLFGNIYKDLEKNFCGEANYVLIMTWKLVATFVQLIDKYRVRDVDIPAEDESENENSLIHLIYSKATTEFGKICMGILKEEIKRYFPSIYIFFVKALKVIFNGLNFNTTLRLAVLKAIQEDTDITEGHLLVVKLLPVYFSDTKDKDESDKILQDLASHPSTEVRMHCQQGQMKTK